MPIINQQVSEITPAYLRIQKAENELQGKWRKPLLAVYAQQREEFEENLAQFNLERAEFRRRLQLGIWMASILLILGILVLPGLLIINEIGDFRGPLFCFSPLLMLAGLTGWAIIVVLWIWQRDREQPIPPENPLKAGLFYPLLPVWKEDLVGSLPKKKPDTDATGEYHFITRLLSITDDAYILYRLQLNNRDNADVVIIGPQGIWVFEVVFQKGLLRWREGEWSLIQTNRKLVKRNQNQVLKINQAFDIKWQRISERISAILGENPDLFGNVPSESLIIRGGLVFSHPQGRYDIPHGCPFNWGIVPFWLEKLASVPELDGMDDGVIFNIMDILLEKHRMQCGVTQSHSMIKVADNIVQTADMHIQNWMDTNQLVNL